MAESLASGVFSTYTLELFESSGVNSEAAQKRSAILFDRLIFHPTGLPWQEMGWTTKSMLVPHAAMDRREREYLKKSKEFSELFTTTDEIADEADAFYERVDLLVAEKRDVLHQPIYDYSEAYLFDALGVKSGEDLQGEDLYAWWTGMKRLLGTLLNDFCLFEAIHEIAPGAVGILSGMHGGVLKVAETAIPEAARPLGLIKRMEEMQMADFSRLSWSSIFELRKSGFLADFRGRLAEMAKAQSRGDLDVSVEVLADLWRLVGDVKPNLPRSYITAVVANLPLPIPFLPNPASVGVAISDITKQRKLQRKHGYLFFIQQARAMIS